MIITTSESVANADVRETLGLVRGNTIKAKHIGKDILAVFRSIVGGEITEYTEALNEARKTAVRRMVQEAENMDADAIISVRFTTSAVMAGAAELLVYGTAVKLRR
jgi:uncharacterized protein YbjQ (UPF0145 family)